MYVHVCSYNAFVLLFVEPSLVGAGKSVGLEERKALLAYAAMRRRGELRLYVLAATLSGSRLRP